jgi:hypothetical protein
MSPVSVVVFNMVLRAVEIEVGARFSSVIFIDGLQRLSSGPVTTTGRGGQLPIEFPRLARWLAEGAPAMIHPLILKIRVKRRCRLVFLEKTLISLWKAS